ncbi:MAG: L,D-transpeptidase family protein [Burkholderiales bacterium]
MDVSPRAAGPRTSWLTAALRRWAAALSLATTLTPALAAPLWFDEAGRPLAEAQQAVQLLAQAADEGLEPQDYDAVALQRAVLQREQQAGAPEATAALDAALSAAMQRYLNDLHVGRVMPANVHQRYDGPAPSSGFDAVAVLQDAVAQRRLVETMRAATPVVPLYAALRQALARYRALAAATAVQQAWAAPLPVLPASTTKGNRKVEPGQPYAGLATLRQRLELLGDLPAGSTPDPTLALPAVAASSAAAPALYEGAVVEAVRAFQARHGLAADGVLGAATLAQLAVPPAQRVRQIALTMERLRWTPLLQAPRMVVINLPEFVLRAYETAPDGRITVRVKMRVIVGKALDTRTPMFDEDMRFIEFSPYWNVPPSIARKELVPELRRHPERFEALGYEFVGADGRVLTTLADAHLDAVLRGQLRIRQRPGPKNALGDIKFVFPNNDNIYLHHTPAIELFTRERRDFSHGCIRVEQPVELARFVLQDMPDWPEARIREAMTQGRSATLKLATPVPVLIAYGTVLVKAGQLVFLPDVYGHDALLEQALMRRKAEPRAAEPGRPTTISPR